MQEPKDVSNWSEERLAGYNDGRKMVGLPAVKPYRAWQVRLCYVILFLFYTYFLIIRFPDIRSGNALAVYGVMGGLNAFGYLWLYFDRQKNNLIILIASAFVWFAAGIEGLPLWFNLIPTITFLITLIVVLIKWNGKPVILP